MKKAMPTKVAAPAGGKEDHQYFRDGFTDLLGKFAYAHVSGKKVKDVQKFSILVSHEAYGSIVKEVEAPTNIQSFEAAGRGKGARHLGKQKWKKK